MLVCFDPAPRFRCDAARTTLSGPVTCLFIHAAAMHGVMPALEINDER